MAEPEFQMGGGGGGGNPDPEITGEAVSKKFCLALQTSVWFKRRGGIQVLGPLPWVRY